MAKVTMFRGANEMLVAAHDVLGDKTAQSEVVDFCTKKMKDGQWNYHGTTMITVSNVGPARREWRKKNKATNNDCRTYDTQFRRNMFADNKISREKINQADSYIRSWGCEGKECEDNVNELKEFLTNFHSIEQIQIYLDVKLGSIKIMAEI